jgi:hypothetical protein
MRCVVVVVASLVALVGRPAGATITIELNAEGRVENGVAFTLSAKNTGNEAAHDVEPEVAYEGKTTKADALAALDPTASHEWKFNLPAPPGTGTYPIVVRLRYADANGYPLSALLVHLQRTAGARSGPARPTLTSGSVSRFGNARLVIENPGPQPLAGRLTLVLPTEFQTDPENQPAQVPAQGRNEMTLVFQNAGALAGSVYPIYATFEYDLDGIHHAVVSNTTVNVVTGSTGTRVPPLVIGGGALLLVIGALVLAWRSAAQRAARRRSADRGTGGAR